MLPRLPAGVIDVDGRQVLHLLLGGAELDTVHTDRGHGGDRDGDFLAAPQVALLEEYVGHVVAARVDDKPLDLPDGAVGDMDVLAASAENQARSAGSYRIRPACLRGTAF